MIISAIFREGIDTPIDLALLDNRIINKKEAILGIIRGNLKYQKLIFNIYPKISYNLADKDFDQRIQKINEKDHGKIGWIYIVSIQMIISATFREGIDTPIDLALLDNRIINKKEAILGIIRGNLKYQKLIFNIYPKIAYNLVDKDFDRTLSLIQNFKRQDFMREGNKPYFITYKIAYAL